MNIHLKSLGLIALVFASIPAMAQDKPNILVIWGDDVGAWNISAYHNGMMGGSTPNIDRIANEGALFTDRRATEESRLHVGAVR